MSKAAAVKEAVKESLLGAEEPVQLSAQTKARFVANAVKDEVSGELYMGPDEFTKAVAPEDEDFVSPGFHSDLTFCSSNLSLLREHNPAPISLR